MELTKEQSIEENFKMWDWLSKNPDKTKDDYLKSIGICIDTLMHGCFLCEYAYFKTPYKENENNNVDCRECPVTWPNENENIDPIYGCYCQGKHQGIQKLYGFWAFYIENIDQDKAIKAAKQMRDLPIREEN